MAGIALRQRKRWKLSPDEPRWPNGRGPPGNVHQLLRVYPRQEADRSCVQKPAMCKSESSRTGNSQTEPEKEKERLIELIPVGWYLSSVGLVRSLVRGKYKDHGYRATLLDYPSGSRMVVGVGPSPEQAIKKAAKNIIAFEDN